MADGRSPPGKDAMSPDTPVSPDIRVDTVIEDAERAAAEGKAALDRVAAQRLRLGLIDAQIGKRQ